VTVAWTGRAIAAVVAGLALGSTACSDLLGYDDLQFEDGAAPGDPRGRIATATGADDGGGADLPHVDVTQGDAGPRPREITGSDASVDASVDVTVPACAAKTCGSDQYCEPTTGACVCSPGFASNGSGGCASSPPGEPTTHSSAEVCAAWTNGHVLSDPNSWTPGPTECDPGTLSQAGVNDTLARLAMMRWLVGLAPVVERTADRAEYMACGAVASWNPPGTAANPHAPEPTAKCYTAQGAAGAGSANLGWGGRNPADAIDQFAEDSGNDTTFGHRRWILNPPLGAVGIGFYAGGGPYGSAQCLGIFDGSGSGPSPDWIAFPPPGFVPLPIATWTWSFHHKSGVATSMTVTRASDGMVLPMTTLPLNQGYGIYAVTAFRPKGWTPSAGESYAVRVEGATPTPIDYVVKPTACP
jgi:hypothetical protein